MASVTGFFHGGITVSDMDASVPFYRDGLGLEVAFDRILDGDYLPVVLDLPLTTIRAVYLHVPGGGYVELLEYRGLERLPAASAPDEELLARVVEHVGAVLGARQAPVLTRVTRWSGVMPGAPYTPRQLPIST